MKPTTSRILIRLIAVYLLWFVVVFILAVAGGAIPFLAEGTVLGDMIIRRPYQMDFELMFTVLFAVWGVFLWYAAKEIYQHRLLIQFTAVALLTHGAVFIVLGILSTHQTAHFLLDSIWWFATGALAWIVYKKNV